MTSNPDYVLGHGQRELQRLAFQAQYWGEATLELLQRAGVTTGMRVLDIGCGAGDVSLLAAWSRPDRCAAIDLCIARRAVR